VKGREREKIIGERVFGALNGKCSNGGRESLGRLRLRGNSAHGKSQGAEPED
jgi:hypothetical protein